MRVTPAALTLGAMLLLGAGPAAAQTLPADEEDFRYLLGLGLRAGPDYWGSEQRSLSLKPLWALRWGRWRISTSGAGGLMGFGNEAVGPGPGASRELFRSSTLRVGFGLRFDSGRNSDAVSSTAGLPDVQRTLRGRLYASYALAPPWQLSGALSQDLLGKRGGAVATIDLTRRLYRSPMAELNAFVSASAGDRRHMLSYFGVPADSPAAQRYGRAYEPGAGLRDATLGANYTRAFGSHWVGYAGASLSTLLGPAADSPLDQRRSAFGWSLGLAYRN
ncbi:MipA/OmpV family protein [Paucibacter sediminis]|uniref:MipA/OmpV family protein n=1 Tax=Paucibacter sediminis TaxID=3019553 RepID=A0AA95NBT1_9BURK|nr:MipA/OmpV family protein [Paucibacter sp. S2-9]WIT11169.1 MipA/OmpV family protein [Paucibacter sp. S2-9]